METPAEETPETQAPEAPKEEESAGGYEVVPTRFWQVPEGQYVSGGSFNQLKMVKPGVALFVKEAWYRDDLIEHHLATLPEDFSWELVPAEFRPKEDTDAIIEKLRRAT